MKEANVILIGLVVALLIWCILQKSKEDLSGFGVTSALAFNNRLAYCDPGYGYPGESYSGGCFLPHRVII